VIRARVTHRVVTRFAMNLHGASMSIRHWVTGLSECGSLGRQTYIVGSLVLSAGCWDHGNTIATNEGDASSETSTTGGAGGAGASAGGHSQNGGNSGVGTGGGVFGSGGATQSANSGGAGGGEIRDATAADVAPPTRSCNTSDDCILVLDYRNGFSCWSQSIVSKADAARDHCLVPATHDPRCTVGPPDDCPYTYPIPVNHSCIMTSCISLTCNEGTCGAYWGDLNACETPDAGLSDCAALLSDFVNTLARAQECDPVKDVQNCTNFSYQDDCGCHVPVNRASPYANAAECARNALFNAHCVLPVCERACVVPSDWSVQPREAYCAAGAPGAKGTCLWQL
jgi:hypothetical protein